MIIFRNQMANLPDKGKKILDLYERVMKELEHRSEIDKAAELFSELNIASIGRNKLNNMEWNGKYNPAKENSVYLDSDDEEEVDPLKIIASSTSSQDKKLVKIEKEETLITEQDLKEIQSFGNSEIVIEEVKLKDKSKLQKLLKSQEVNHNNQSELLEPHAVYLCEKESHCHPNTNKYLPFKTTKTNVHDPEKERARKQGKHWENTAATPPPIQHNGVKMISLQESIEAENIQRERMKVVIEKQAEDRLASRLERQKTSKTPKVVLPVDSHSNLYFKNYRDILEEDPSDQEDNGSQESEQEYGDE